MVISHFWTWKELINRILMSTQNDGEAIGIVMISLNRWSLCLGAFYTVLRCKIYVNVRPSHDAGVRLPYQPMKKAFASESLRFQSALPKNHGCNQDQETNDTAEAKDCLICDWQWPLLNCPPGYRQSPPAVPPILVVCLHGGGGEGEWVLLGSVRNLLATFALFLFIRPST